MTRKLLFSFVALFLFMVSLSFGQTMEVKTAWNFPVLAEDSLLNGLKSIRGITAHQNPLGDGTAAFVATNYALDGSVSVFRATGDDAIELVWSSTPPDSNGGNSTPRYPIWGDLDNDGIIEIIYQNNRNGIMIWEWDGVADSWNFGDAPARVIGEPDIPLTGNGYTEYLNAVQDLDGDGVNELLLSINSTPNANDRYYIFSITGNYSTGDPGFSFVNKEAEFIKSDLPYSNYGGGTPFVALSGNLDGVGNPELLFHNWNYFHLTPLTVPAADTYQLADTTNGKNYYYATYPSDDVALLPGDGVLDVDGDGREEIYIPNFYGTGDVFMIHYEEGQSTSEIDSSNVFMLDFEPTYGSNIFGLGYGDYDKDGKPNIYVSGGYGHLVNSAEFQGGDKTDPANWTFETLYAGDSTIYSAITVWDSAGVVDSVFSVDVSFVSKFAAKNTDIDNDGHEDMILGFQALSDSIAVTNYSWNGASYDTTEFNILNPKRHSIRMLESSVASGLEAKDFSVVTPTDYVLEQNYPNPFNPTTNISFVLPINKKISLTVYNTLGQKVKTLVNNEVLVAGKHDVTWDGTNESGAKVASGMYMYTLKFGNFTKSKRMMLVK